MELLTGVLLNFCFGALARLTLFKCVSGVNDSLQNGLFVFFFVILNKRRLRWCPLSTFLRGGFGWTGPSLFLHLIVNYDKFNQFGSGNEIALLGGLTFGHFKIIENSFPSLILFCDVSLHLILFEYCSIIALFRKKAKLTTGSKSLVNALSRIAVERDLSLDSWICKENLKIWITQSLVDSLGIL